MWVDDYNLLIFHCLHNEKGDRQERKENTKFQTEYSDFKDENQA